MTVTTYGVASLLWLVACAPPPSTAPATNPVYVSSSATVAVNDTAAPEPSPATVAPGARRVLVLVDKHVDRPTEVLGVLDFHSDATSQDKGFEELRARASEMGADAVIAAEFEHGDGNEPSHLSGMVVRFLDTDR